MPKMIHIQYRDSEVSIKQGIPTSLFTEKTRGIAFRDTYGDIDICQTIFLDKRHPPVVTDSGIVMEAFYDGATGLLIRQFGEKPSTGYLILIQGVRCYKIQGAYKMIRYAQRSNSTGHTITDMFFWAMIGVKISVQYPEMPKKINIPI